MPRHILHIRSTSTDDTYFKEFANNVWSFCTKMETTLFFPSKLKFTEKLSFEFCASDGCGISKEIALLNSARQSIHRGKFRHLKYSVNVNFDRKNRVVSILMFEFYETIPLNLNNNYGCPKMVHFKVRIKTKISQSASKVSSILF